MTKEAALSDWQLVPERVQTLFPAAYALQLRHNKVASDSGILAIASVHWDPDSACIFIHTPAKLSARINTAYANTLNPGCQLIFTTTTPDAATTISIKRASIAHGLGDAWRGANKAFLGPTPLSNAIVSSLALGGLGYGVGTLAEQIFPDRYLERGRLRNPLAVAGVLAGAGIGAANAGETQRQLQKFYPDYGYWRSWVTDNNTPIPPPAASEKTSQFAGSFTNLGAPTIPVDAFNRAVWADASKGYDQTGIVEHTSPPIAAATTGLMRGFAAQARSPIISPATVITGLASAGVGLATAHIAGRTIGALAGLSPGAQEKIQDVGLWAGMLHTVIPPLFGGR